ncbi:MAG: right-handed parallel beta-helix repeat-containing protein, partial [Anaerolineae bacterium]
MKGVEDRAWWRLFVALIGALGLILAVQWAIGNRGGGVAASPNRSWGRRLPSRAAREPVGAPSAQVTELHVCPSGCAYASIQEAVDDATGGDVIKVASGLYSGVSSRPIPPGYALGESWEPSDMNAITQVVYISKSLNVRGGYSPPNWDDSAPGENLTTLDAQGLGRVLVIVGDVKATVEGLRFTGGDAEGLRGHPWATGTSAGGGLYVLSGTATISECWIGGNTADFGGGVFLDHADITFAGNEVTLNAGHWGGGLYAHYSYVIIHKNTFTGNSVAGVTPGMDIFPNRGGALEITEGSGAEIAGNLITSNDSEDCGGGLALGGDGVIEAYDNDISTNTAFTGGGVCLLETAATLSGNTLYSNIASGHGGGVYELNSAATIISNTISGNTAGADGGGLYLNREWGSKSPTVTGNLISHNSARDGGGLCGDFGGGETLINGNTFRGNTASQSGGGLSLQFSEAILDGNTIISNTATNDGGGVAVFANGPRLLNNVIAQNQAGGRGEDLFVEGASPELLHTTVACSSGGSGIYISEHPFTGASTVALTNTIVANHDHGVYVSGGNTLAMDGVLWWNNAVTVSHDSSAMVVVRNQRSGDPAFVDSAAGDYHIGSASNALDVCVASSVDHDMDSQVRPMGWAADLGADEYPGPHLVLDKQASLPAVNQGQEISYTVVITNDGEADATGTILTDTLDTWQRVSSVPGSCTVSDAGWGSVVVCGTYSLSKGAGIELGLTAEVLSTAGVGQAMTNTARLSADETFGRTAQLTIFAQDCHARVNDDPTAYTTVQEAVDAAGKGDTVKVAGNCLGVYERAGRPQQVAVDKDLSIQGGYTTTNWTTVDLEANPTTLDARGLGRVFYVSSGALATLSGLRIIGGSTEPVFGAGGTEGIDDAGGGICGTESTLVLRDSILQGNLARYGGGLCLRLSDAVLSGNTITSNTATSGGGGMYLMGSDATVTATAISNNTGGGLQMAGTDGTVLSGNTIVHNRGNGVGMAGSDAALSDNVVSNNDDAGLEMYRSSPTIINNVIADNQSDDEGAGVRVVASSPSLIHSTIARNGRNGASGIYVTEYGDWSNVVLTNTILVGHAVGISVAGGNTVTVNGILWHNTPVTVSSAPTAVVGVLHQFTGDPAFASDGYHVGSGSAAVNRGVDAGLSTDIDGESRPYGSSPDLGADERSSAILVTNANDSGPGSLRQAMEEAISGDTVAFDLAAFPPSSPATITLASPLPDITQGNLTIDASGAGVILDGSGVGELGTGLQVASSGNVIQGLQILNFPSNGVYIGFAASNNLIGGATAEERNVISGNGWNGVKITGSGSHHNTVSGNYIGTDASGTKALPNGQQGVYITSGATYCTVGGDTPGERNLISGNGDLGVLIEASGTMSNTVLGNYIGTDVSGSFAIGNAHGGVAMSSGATNNLIGGDVPGDRNLISGNGHHGVFIKSSTSNTASGNYIGVDVTGSSALPNGTGVTIQGEASYNTVGGDTPGERNIISGNDGKGIQIDSADAISNTVVGNFIGTDVSGTHAIGNSGNGVFLYLGARYNVIGGTTSGEGNLISGNGENGVGISYSGTMSNTVIGNFIGTDVTGDSPIPNALAGVEIDNSASYNLIGGSTPGERNVISGNGENGVAIYGPGTTRNTVSGNYIGTNPAGAAGLGNVKNGVWIAEGADCNLVGGDWAGARNLISGNYWDGINIYGSGASSNTIAGNYIGTDVSGSADLSNDGNGIFVGGGASYNIIGGDWAGERNIISGNGSSGIHATGSDTRNNIVSGNYIGLNASGDAALPNGQKGVRITDGSGGNLIGGDGAGERNVISGNDSTGIVIDGALSNTVSANYIGTNAAGTASIGNGGIGVEMAWGAQHNVIGGSTPGTRNLISGNEDNGIWIGDSGTSHNTVSGNYIGTDATGTSAIANGWAGVHIAHGAANNTIGGGGASPEGDCDPQCNLISGNTWNGVFIGDSGTISNDLSGNHIGTNVSGTAAIPNGGDGVSIGDGASDNIIGPSNTIAHNDGYGVRVYTWQTLRNTITQNHIHDNDGEGIGLEDGGNAGLAAPKITSVSEDTISGTACAGCTVEVFSDEEAQGRVYEGTTVASGQGLWSLHVGQPATGPRLTATATDVDGNTSEFSSPWALELLVTKDASTLLVAPDQTVAYTIVITNGRMADLTGVVVTDTLDALLKAATVSPAATCTIEDADYGGDVVCHLGTLSPGARFSATLMAIVSSELPAGEGIVNQVTVAANEATQTARASVVSPAGLVYPLGSEPETLDINRAGDGIVVAQLMEGLYRYGSDGDVEPAGATGHTVSSDGLVYTLTLRSEAAWSDGQAVTAQHYADSVLRTLDPGTGADYPAWLLYPIAGAELFNSGVTTDPTTVGVTAVGSHTLRFALEEPTAHFPATLATFASYPVRLDLISSDPQW